MRDLDRVGISNSNQPTELLPLSGNNEELVAFTIRSSVLFYSVLQYEDVDFCVSFNFRKILPQSNSAKRIHLIFRIRIRIRIVYW